MFYIDILIIMSHDVLTEIQCIYYSYQKELSQSNGTLIPEKYDYYLSEFKTYIRILDEVYHIALKKTPTNDSEIRALELMMRKINRILSSEF
jgi:hypothetical protein